jgi:hypothetical protein
MPESETTGHKGDRDTDELRLQDLARAHDLTFKRKRSTYIFDEFTAHGLKQALGYVEGYDRAASQAIAMKTDTPGKAAWRLLLADDPDEIKVHEIIYGRSQADTANDFIENSDWTASMGEFAGSKGAPRERLLSLRAVYRKQEAGNG